MCPGKHGVAQQQGVALVAGLQKVGRRVDGALVGIDQACREIAALEAGEAAHAPLGVGHLADELLLEGVFGLKCVFEGGDLGLELGGVFVGQDGIAGEKVVLDGVLRDAGFAFFRSRTG